MTILPAGQALGVTEQLPEAERHLYPESYLKDSLAVRLGGRAAEVLVLGEASTGAPTTWPAPPSWPPGWSASGACPPRLGPIGFASDGPGYLGEGGFSARPYAEDTQRTIDEEVARPAPRSRGQGHRTALQPSRGPRPGGRAARSNAKSSAVTSFWPPSARPKRRPLPPRPVCRASPGARTEAVTGRGWPFARTR